MRKQTIYKVLVGALLLTLRVSASELGVLIESDQVIDPIPVTKAPSLIQEPPVPVPRLLKIPAATLALSGLPTELPGSTFQFGMYRPVTYSPTDGGIAIARVGIGIFDWLGLGVGSEIERVFESHQRGYWFDLSLRPIRTERFALTVNGGWTLRTDSLDHDRPSQLTFDARFGRREAATFHIQAISAKNRSYRAGGSDFSVGRLAFLLDQPLAPNHYLTLGISIVGVEEKYGYSYQYREGSSTRYVRNDTTRSKFGIPVGLGYRYETDTFTASLGLEAGPASENYQTVDSNYTYMNYDYSSFSVIDLVNIAGSVGMRF